jgi:hypothetical protein
VRNSCVFRNEVDGATDAWQTVYLCTVIAYEAVNPMGCSQVAEDGR